MGAEEAARTPGSLPPGLNAFFDTVGAITLLSRDAVR